MKNTIHFCKAVGFFVFLFLAIVLTSCDQEPLFWDIAHEYPPISPDVYGSPSKIVELGSSLYVTNAVGVWKYDPVFPFWVPMVDNDTPSFVAKDLAVAGTNLFALDRNGNIWKWNNPGWSIIYAEINTEKLFGAGTYLYTAVLTGIRGSSSGYSIRCLDINGVVQSGRGILNTGLLMETVYFGFNGKTYIGTLGNGLYVETAGSFAKDAFFSNETIIGMTVYNDKIFIVTPALVYCYDGSTPPGAPITGGYRFTGAIAGWTDDGTNHNLLLLGLMRTSGSFGYGYREILIDTNGAALGGLRIPGEGFEIASPLPWPIALLSSVKINSQYVSAIGKYAINYLYVMPHTFLPYADDGETAFSALPRPIIFASTAKDGLLSYRTRNGVPQWNGEDKTPF